MSAMSEGEHVQVARRIIHGLVHIAEAGSLVDHLMAAQKRDKYLDAAWVLAELVQDYHQRGRTHLLVDEGL